MSKFRTDGRDTYKAPPEKPQAKPGELPANRIPIYDHKGRRRGHVGYGASEATVSRFTGTGAKLRTKNNRPAWIGVTSGRGSNKAAEQQNAKVEKSLRSAKGSNP